MTGPGHQLLARRGLRQVFRGCDEALIIAALQRLRFRTLAPGEVLMRVDALARSAYLLLEGTLQVYGRRQDGALVAIATLTTPGRLVGEQALLPGHSYRNADVIALGPALVGELPADAFADLLQADPAAQQRLQRQGMAELRDRLGRLGVGLEEAVVGDSGSVTLQLDPGARLLTAGQVPAEAYSLVAGQLSLWPPGGASPVLTLGPGALVGVAELAAGRPCHDTVIADTASEVLPISPERLRPLLGQGEGAGSLQSLVAVPGLGRVYRSRHLWEGELVVISDCTGLPGGPVRVRQIPGRRRLEATRRLPPEARTDLWLSPDGRNQLLVEPQTGRLLGLAMEQSWPQLGELIAALLRDRCLSRLQLQAFRASGQLLLESPEERLEAGSEVICPCTGTTAGRLRELVRDGGGLETLQRCTAAGTVCGGCLDRLALVLQADPDRRLCRLQTTPLTRRTLDVRLLPIDGQPLPSFQVGQHLPVEALIDGRWIGRPCTLIGGDARGCELAITREEGDGLSHWLAEAEPGSLVRVGLPDGRPLTTDDDPRPLLVLVGGSGILAAIAACRGLSRRRSITVACTFRGEPAAAGLEELRAAARQGVIRLLEHDSSRQGRLQRRHWLEPLQALLQPPLEVLIAGPEGFRRLWRGALHALPGIEVRSVNVVPRGQEMQAVAQPGGWRRTPAEMAVLQRRQERRFGPAVAPVPVGRSCPIEEIRAFLEAYRREEEPALDPERWLAAALEERQQRGVCSLSHSELRFGARLAWRQAERCVGRLHWRSLELFDRRDLRRADDIAEALFEHLRFAFHGGDLRPAISVFDPGEPDRPGPRLWNPQLLRYAGHRDGRGRQVGDPAQNALTGRLKELGWRPSGDAFELLPLVIETAAEGPRLFPLPDDCRQEVRIVHPRHGWLESLGLRWYAVPAVSDMALDLAGTLYRLAPFNGWYLDTEIAARNLSDTNRFNLLPRIAEGLGLDLGDDRSLWRDQAQLVLAEAVLHSFDRAGVRIADHHGIGHEFLEFCRQEQSQGREPQAEWGWMVPPMSGSLNVLYQESFDNRALKPAFVPQPPVWAAGSADPAIRCPFSA